MGEISQHYKSCEAASWLIHHSEAQQSQYCSMKAATSSPSHLLAHFLFNLIKYGTELRQLNQTKANTFSVVLEQQ
jgi:hypothetical protein